MDETMNTPPKSTSRASTIAADSHGRDSQTSPSRRNSETSDLEVVQVNTLINPEIKPEPAVFEPHKMLLETTVTVEYGPKLDHTLTIHEELLRSHSKGYDGLYIRTNPIREQYAQTKAQMDLIAGYVFPEVSADQFEEECMEKRAIPVITQIYQRFPLIEARKTIKNIIDAAIEEQLGRKNTKAPISGKKRNYREMSSDTNVKDRLFLLNSRGMHEVTNFVYAKTHKLLKTLQAKAIDDAERAAAQRRIILPNYDDPTVPYFVQWLYHDVVRCEHPAQLYMLLQLSDELGTEKLSDICLTELCNSTHDSIRRAHIAGVSIPSLLVDNGSDSTENVLEIIFSNVFKDKNPPEKLLRLVIDTLAQNIDMKLWKRLKDLMSQDMALRLIEAMIERQQSITQATNHHNMKSENGSDFNAQPYLNGNNNESMYAD